MSIAPRVEFPELVAVTLRDRVVTAVKDSFFSGLLKPGNRIVERQIAREMGIGTPAVREALIALQEQGFVKRVTNTATHVTKYSIEEVEQLYDLRLELEVLAFQWAKPRHTEQDLQTLEKTIQDMIVASEVEPTRRFYELDLFFHRQCWQLCGNKYLADALERIVAPLFAFVPVASGIPVSRAVAQEHHTIVNALRNLQEPQFSNTVRSVLSSFALRGMAMMARQGDVEHAAEDGAQPQSYA
ncbi:MAG: GntR family transcriptional regulator [Acidobacteria bacterium]|nr:GntR family transcriptional regulator [Acidobacteriota bacterium]